MDIDEVQSGEVFRVVKYDITEESVVEVPANFIPIIEHWVTWPMGHVPPPTPVVRRLTPREVIEGMQHGGMVNLPPEPATGEQKPDAKLSGGRPVGEKRKRKINLQE